MNFDLLYLISIPVFHFTSFEFLAFKTGQNIQNMNILSNHYNSDNQCSKGEYVKEFTPLLVRRKFHKGWKGGIKFF